MVKFAHLADVHLGYRQFNRDERYNDFFKAFENVVDKIIENNCDFVIISGDLFDSIPRPHVINDSIEILKKLKKENIPAYVIEGNHDKAERVPSPIILLSNIGFVNYIGFSKFKFGSDKIKTFGEIHYGYGVFEECEIHGLGYRRDKEAIEKLLGFIPEPKGELNILMLHQTVVEPELLKVMYLPDFDLDVTQLNLSEFDYFALGHIHKKYIFSNKKIVYPGATEMNSIAEADFLIKNGEEKRLKENRKGFIIYDNGKLIDQTIEVRPSYWIVFDDLSDIKELIKVLDNIEENAIVSIKYAGKKIDESYLWKKYEHLLLVGIKYIKKENIQKTLVEKENTLDLSKIKNLIKEINSFKKGNSIDFESLKEFYLSQEKEHNEN